MISTNRRKITLINIIIVTLMCFAIAACSCSKQPEPQEVEPDEVQEIDVTEGTSEEQTVEEPESPFSPYDSADEEVVFGDVKAGDIFEEVRKVRRSEEDVNWDIISIDMGEYCGVRGESADVCYTFKDLNGDGTDELIFGDENGYPLSVYIIKNGAMHLPDLVYFKMPNSISSDGVINTMQGSGIPDDAHKDGYFFRIDPSASDGIVESEPGTDEPMQFDWKLFQ